jgi:kinesin family protein 5
MAFLERNLEQLTHVQRQLVEQNSSLKKEVAIAERKLIARNERIQSLESLLQDSQEKLTAANHRYTLLFVQRRRTSRLIDPRRFEAQLTAVKERLEAAKTGSTRGLGGAAAAQGGFSFSGAGGRVAKPLRGGGGETTIPAVQGLQNEGAGGGNKRTSWFFSGQK